MVEREPFTLDDLDNVVLDSLARRRQRTDAMFSAAPEPDSMRARLQQALAASMAPMPKAGRRRGAGARTNGTGHLPTQL